MQNEEGENVERRKRLKTSNNNNINNSSNDNNNNSNENNNNSNENNYNSDEDNNNTNDNNSINNDNNANSVVSLPGGGLRCTDPECTGPLICPTRKIHDLAEPGLKCYKYNVTVKVRVLTKTPVREGVFRLTANRWAMFDMHVTNAAGEEKEVYATVFHHALELHKFIRVGKVYIFSNVVLTHDNPRYSQLNNEFSISFGKETLVFPVSEDIGSLIELSLGAVAAAAASMPKKEMIPYLESIPSDVLEKLFHGRYLTFETISTLYYTKQFNSLIPSSIFSYYIMTRETCLVHACEYHQYSNLYQDLHCVFDDITPFQFTTLDQDEKDIRKLLESERCYNKGFPIVKSLEAFKRQFKIFTRNILEGLNWKNLFCAGGAVLATLNPLPESIDSDEKFDVVVREYYERNSAIPGQPSNFSDANLFADAVRNFYGRPTCPYWNSDIDIFIYGLNTEEEYEAKLREVITTITKNFDGPTFLVHTANTVTIVPEHPYRIVQIVLIPSCSPAYVLTRFDIDCVCVGFDGEKVWASQRGIRAITKRYNLIDPDRVHKAYAYRLYKYALRGYSVGVPYENNSAESILDTINLGYTHTNLFGRLLLFSVKMKNHNFLDLETISGWMVSPYSAHIPWGPNVTIEQARDRIKETDLQMAETFEDLVKIHKEERDITNGTWEAKQVRKTFSVRNEREAWLVPDSLEDESPYYQRITGPIAHLLPQKPAPNNNFLCN